MPKEKLIRDRIPERALGRGDVLSVRTALPNERIPLLIAKVREELAEFETVPSMEEAADLLTAVESLFSEHGMPFNEVSLLADDKLGTHGGFSKYFVLCTDE